MKINDFIVNLKYSANYIYLGLFVCIFIFPFLVINSYPDWGDDWALYLAQAKSIAENNYNNFQNYYQFLVQNSEFKSPAVGPWGYPIIASLTYKFFEKNYLFLKLQQIFFIFIFYIVLFYGFRRNLNIYSRLILISLFGLNIFFLNPINTPSTDYLYLTLSITSIIGIYNFFERKYYYFNRYFDILLLSLLIAFTESVRGVGISLFITIFIVQIKNLFLFLKEHKFYNINIFLNENLTIYLTPYLIFIFYKLYTSNILPVDQYSYINDFSKINISLFIRNIFYYLKLISYFFSNYAKVGIFFYLSFLYPFYIGLKKYFKYENTFFIYGLINLIILLAFPHLQGIRFLYPILPFFFYYALIGLNILFKRKKSKTKIYKKIYKIIFSFLIAYWIFAYFNFQLNIVKFKNDSPFSSDFIETVETIKSFTKKEDKFLFFKPFLLQYLTERESFHGRDISQLYKTDYFLHYKERLSSNNLLNDAIKNEDIKLEQFLVNGKFTLFRVLKN